MSTAVSSSVDWQTGFLAVLPAVETHAKIQFRRLPIEQRQDAVQEAIASACASYQRLAVRGRLHAARPGSFATFAVNYVRNHRHVGGHQNARDVMSPICQHRHGVRVHRFHAAPSGDILDGWRYLTLPNRKAKIPDLAAFRIDFAHWLKTLTRRNQKIVNLLAAGERTSTIADQFGISWGRISNLRRKFERWWRTFQGEPAEAAA